MNEPLIFSRRPDVFLFVEQLLSRWQQKHEDNNKQKNETAKAIDAGATAPRWGLFKTGAGLKGQRRRGPRSGSANRLCEFPQILRLGSFGGVNA